MTPARKALLEKLGNHDVGRDPRRVTQDELVAAGHKPMSPMKAIRLRCLDCCAEQPSEVRRCTAVTCPSWPFRMGKNPWRQPPSEARRKGGAELARGAGNSAPGRRVARNSEASALTLPSDATLEKIDDRNDDFRLVSRAAEGGA